MQNHDIYLRHATVNSGDWIGFTLATPNLTGARSIPSLPSSSRLHTRFRPWLLDPDNPTDPTSGTPGTWQWRLTLAIIPLPVGLLYTPPDPPLTPTEQRDLLLQLINIPAIQLQDTDTTTYTVTPTTYTEQSIDPQGGWLTTIELAESS